MDSLLYKKGLSFVAPLFLWVWQGVKTAVKGRGSRNTAPIVGGC